MRNLSSRSFYIFFLRIIYHTVGPNNSSSSYNRTSDKPRVCDNCGRSYTYRGSYLNPAKHCGIENSVASDPRQPVVTTVNAQNADYHYCSAYSYCTASRWSLKKHVENKHLQIPAYSSVSRVHLVVDRKSHSVFRASLCCSHKSR